MSHNYTMIRRKLWWRGWRSCYWCNVKLNKRNLTVEHLLPKSLGGGYEYNNIVAACKDCNSRRRSSINWLPFYRKISYYDYFKGIEEIVDLT